VGYVIMPVSAMRGAVVLMSADRQALTVAQAASVAR
jgi:hypothetical protein